MPMLERNTNTEIAPSLPHAALEQQQRRRMLIALGVLLVALISVVIKDRQFWFPPSPSTESETPEAVVPARNPVSTPAKTIAPRTTAKPVVPPAGHPRTKSKRRTTSAPSTEAQDGMSPVIVATNRAVLPPLEVEVVAGNQHRAFSPADNSVKLNMESSAPDASEQTTPSAQSQNSAPAASRSAAHVQLSPGGVQVVSRVDPSYPLLAKQMKVQGAVILEALISRTGSIQDIQVLSGPAILSEAAREAVKQWHFKPYYQDGRPVETEARITVNFTISTY